MLISIIIATYNASNTLKRCLDSIVSQITSETELVIIDGGSKDDTNEIINSYGDKISVHISEPDKGIYDAWNKGIKLSHGVWIMFIGADDILLPNAVNTYLDTIKNTVNINSYDYICAHNEFVDMKGNVLKIMGKEPTWNRMRRYMSAAHVASLHNRKNLFNVVGLYNLNFKICADYELLLRKKGHLSYLFINTHIAQMRIGGMSFSVQAIIETFKIRKQHKSISEGINALLFIRDWLAYNFFIIINILKGRTIK